MANKSLLDIESDQPDDRSSATERKSAVMDDLITSVAIIKSNYATKEELAVINGKLDALISLQHSYATKAEMAEAVYQLTWRMAGFAVASISATVAFIRYL
jgi:hypothetical protein